MKKLLLCLALTLPFTAQANGVDCGEFRDFARVVMEARQSEVAKSRVLAIPMTPLMVSVVHQAWELPVLHREDQKRIAITGFADLYYQICVGG
jgi:hypothetical protein